MPRLSRSSPPARLPEGEIRDLLAILLDSPVTPARFWAAADASRTLDETRLRLARERSDARSRAALLAAADAELARAADSGTQVVSFGSPGYPAALLTLSDPPPALWIRGVVDPAEERVIAVVGARKATVYGRCVARRLGGEFAAAGAVVVSGLARGVDVAAHEGAMERGGVTWAVLGSGLDETYPAEHGGCALRVVKTGGAVLSEFPQSTRPHAAHFPRRNRVIAGLAAAVVVVEAARESGSLITADFAMEQGKEVGAVPGPAGSPESEGTHALLRDGVALVEGALDVFRALDLPWAREAARLVEPSRGRTRVKAPDLDGELGAIWGALGTLPRGVDDLAAELSLPASRVRAALVRLEIAGIAQAFSGSLYCRATEPP
jgi:DNA processing protein